MKETITLYADNTREGNLAKKYSESLNPTIISNYDNDLEKLDEFAVSFFINRDNSPFPLLVLNSSEYENSVYYSSFLGVKSFLRKRFKNKNTKKDFNNIEGKIVCYEKNKVVWGGDKESKSPYDFKELLESHPLKEWNKIKIGKICKLEDLIIQKNPFLSFEDLIIFPDEIDLLKNNQKIITHDIASGYHVEQEFYYLYKEFIYKLNFLITD
jgi:hypothetical protein